MTWRIAESGRKVPKTPTSGAQEAEQELVHKDASGLTYNQQLKQDAMLWAEFLYAEYKRHKALLEEAQTKPTYYDTHKT